MKKKRKLTEFSDLLGQRKKYKVDLMTTRGFAAITSVELEMAFTERGKKRGAELLRIGGGDETKKSASILQTLLLLGKCK